MTRSTWVNKKIFMVFVTISSSVITGTLIFCLVKEGIKKEIPNENIMNVDPIFGQTLSDTNPQTVHWYEAGDDIRPNLYEVVYFPEVVTNGTQGHYEVYRTLGKDR